MTIAAPPLIIGRPRINRNIALGRDLQCVIWPAFAHANLVNGRPITPTLSGGAQLQPSKMGVGYRHSLNTVTDATYAIPTEDRAIGADDATVFVVFSANDIAASSSNGANLLTLDGGSTLFVSGYTSGLGVAVQVMDGSWGVGYDYNDWAGVTIKNGGQYCLAMTWRKNGTGHVMLNGELLSTETCTNNTFGHAGAGTSWRFGNTSASSCGGYVSVLGGSSRRAFTLPELIALTTDPWQLFTPTRRPAIFLPAGAPTPSTQTVTLSGISSAEAIGSATISGAAGAQTVTLSGISSSETVGSATITPGAVSLTLTGISSGETIGSQTVTPGPVTVTLSGIASAQAFGTSTVSVGPVTVTAPAIASAEAIGTLTLNPGAVTVTLSGVASAQAFGTSTITAGGVSVIPTGVASAEVIGTLFAQREELVSLSGVTSGEAVGTQVISSGSVSVVPSAISSAEAIGTLTLNPGAVSVTATAITSAEAVGTQTLTTGAVTVTLTGISSAETIGSTVVTAGGAYVILTGLTSGEAVGTLFAQAEGLVTWTGVSSGEEFGLSAIQPGAVTVTTTGIASAQALGAAVVSAGGTSIFADGVISGEAFGTASYQPGPVTITLSGVSSQAAVGNSIVGLLLPVIMNTYKVQFALKRTVNLSFGGGMTVNKEI